MSNSNRLIQEKSPYLLQHAHNPVDWFPWGDEAFKKAKKEDKPIFLSIGYSTCYWCHVMEREVFEQEEIAKIMNDLFVNIKVDREERPDVDRVYMAALQSMTGSGGWPMSMFLSPDLKPFYGATYIPPTSKYGLPGFEDLIQQIHKAWNTRRLEIDISGDEIINHIKNSLSHTVNKSIPGGDIFVKTFEQFKVGFDEEHGGFGIAPKFPRPVGLNFLLRYYRRFKENEALKIVVRTLMRMAKGGIHDHLGGGFHRYSVDRFWIVPHFEKMLYDQALLAISYIETYQITGDNLFADTAKDIIEYVSKKLTHKEGGFYSAEDAESFVKLVNSIDPVNKGKKEEGAFYVWEKSEIMNSLGEKNAAVFCFYFGVGDKGNAPADSDPHNVFVNKNILWNAHSLSETSNKYEISTDEANRIIKESSKKLFDEREKRPLPHLDDKILVSWNGLMISAYAKAYQVFGEEKYLLNAKRSTEFILAKLYNDTGKTLLHRYREGEARFEGTLEDYAFFVQSLLDLYESCFEVRYLDYAIKLSDSMINIFYDVSEGGFFDISGNDKSILIKTKEDYDSAEPTGNSIAILNLLRLSQFTDNEEYHIKAQSSLEYFSPKMSEQPYSMPQIICTLDYYLNKPKQIILAGNRNDSVTKQMLNEVYKRFIPNKILICVSAENIPLQIPFLNLIIKKSNVTIAYICENYTCKLPVSDVNEFIKLLEE
jgi:uncharacterized protein YyaL (SSP411 family)